jgi:hypothetical protein
MMKSGRAYAPHIRLTANFWKTAMGIVHVVISG